MDVHENAHLTPLGREESVRRVVVERQTPNTVAAAFGVCACTVRTWVGRYRAEGKAIYQRSDVVFSGGKAVPRNGDN